MFDCANVEMRELLPELASGTLDAATRARVEQHVASCVECASELETLRLVRSAGRRAADRGGPAHGAATVARCADAHAHHAVDGLARCGGPNDDHRWRAVARGHAPVEFEPDRRGFVGGGRTPG